MRRFNKKWKKRTIVITRKHAYSPLGLTIATRCQNCGASVEWGPQVNKCKQLSDHGYQKSLVGKRGSMYSEVLCLQGRGKGGPCTMRSHVYGGGARAGEVPVQWGPMSGGGPWTVRSNASWVMVTWGPPVNRLTDRHTHDWRVVNITVVRWNNSPCRYFPQPAFVYFVPLIIFVFT